MKKYITLLFVSIMHLSMYAQDQFAEARVLDVQLHRFEYLSFSTDIDSLKNDAGCRYDYFEKDRQPVSIATIAQHIQSSSTDISIEEVTDSSIFLQYILVSKQDRCGLVRYIHSSKTGTLTPFYSFGCMEGNKLLIDNSRLVRQPLWTLIGELNRRGLGNLRRKSFFKKTGTLKYYDSCIDSSYGRVLDLNCLSEKIFDLPIQQRNSFFKAMNNDKN